eukprot:CAMPEP_0194046682 /NCGR_PEP_ID=MMETSP0009_2-20130614/22242_1 /TAXON_ID=210454 /ORGANISM="Grammatophora oceanica, Strain CCMP 410" /LENGTH=690 /DNA_ID=CAMNT_0038692077 /DNA_START=113 /DNA_END=2185 /DNA_ORIENTATION=-
MKLLLATTSIILLAEAPSSCNAFVPRSNTWAGVARQRLSTSSSQTCSTTSLGISNIGLGPTEEETTEIDYDKLVPGVDYEVPDHESHRLDRRSKLDERCDAWYGELLGAENGVLGDIAAGIRTRLMTKVELKNEKQLPYEHPEFTPYVNTKLPWSILYPAYGLEEYGVPVPRRNAEAWRHFDVPGMVAQDYSQTVEGSGTELVLSDEETASMKAKLEKKGTWLEDDKCFARLIYVNGRFVPSLSKTTDTICNMDTSNISEKDAPLLSRLTDGFTDRLAGDVPFSNDDGDHLLKSFAKLSKPDHCMGDCTSQFAINAQQGTASLAALNTVKTGAVAYVRYSMPGDPESDEPPMPVLIINAVSKSGGGTANEDEKGVAMHPRTLAVAEDGSSLALIQSMVDLDSDGEEHVPKLYNGYTQVFVEGNANVTHSYLEETGGFVTPDVELMDKELEEGQVPPRSIESARPELKDTHLETVDVHCTGDESFYAPSIMSIGGSGRIRLAFSISLLRPRSEANVHGFSLTGGAQRTDVKTSIHHMGQGTTSQQLQKNMVGGRGTGSFRGRVRVEQSAQQTDSDQLCRTILLSDRCKSWSMPSLEIVADDVKCTHGATVADLSDEELFYLRSRGITQTAARNLLMFAYADDISKTVHPSMLAELGATTDAKTGLQKRITARLLNLVPKGDRAMLGELHSI